MKTPTYRQNAKIRAEFNGRQAAADACSIVRGTDHQGTPFTVAELDYLAAMSYECAQLAGSYGRIVLASRIGSACIARSVGR